MLCAFVVVVKLSMHLTSACWTNLDRIDLLLAISQRFEFITQTDRSLKYKWKCLSHFSSIQHTILKIRFQKLQRNVHQHICQHKLRRNTLYPVHTLTTIT